MMYLPIYSVLFLVFGITCNNAEVTVGFTLRSDFRVGDDTLDAAPVINKAIQKAVQEDSRVVFFEAGVYNISTPILLSSNIELKAHINSNTTFRLVDNTSDWWNTTASASGMIRIVDATDVRISFITLDGNSDNQIHTIDNSLGKYGVYIETSDTISLYNLRIVNFPGYGIALHRSPETSVNGVSIDFVEITNNNWDGVIVDGYINVQIRSSNIAKNKRHGVNVVRGSSNIVIMNNKISDNGFYFPSSVGGAAVNLDLQSTLESAEVHVRENIITNNLYAGVQINSAMFLNISRNTIDISQYCLVISQTSSSNFTKNVCKNILTNSNLVDDTTQLDATNRFLLLPFSPYNATISIDTFSTNTTSPPEVFPEEKRIISEDAGIDSIPLPNITIPSYSPRNRTYTNNGYTLELTAKTILGCIVLMLIII